MTVTGERGGASKDCSVPVTWWRWCVAHQWPLRGGRLCDLVEQCCPLGGRDAEQVEDVEYGAGLMAGGAVV